MARYLSDLLMSMCLALTVGWLFQAAIGNIHLRDAMITQNGMYVAMRRFTPGNLVASYVDTVEHMTQHAPVSYHLADGVGPGMEQTVAMVGTAVAGHLLRHTGHLDRVSIGRPVASQGGSNYAQDSAWRSARCATGCGRQRSRRDGSWRVWR